LIYGRSIEQDLVVVPDVPKEHRPTVDVAVVDDAKVTYDSEGRSGTMTDWEVVLVVTPTRDSGTIDSSLVFTL
jgi:hypothetical protein